MNKMSKEELLNEMIGRSNMDEAVKIIASILEDVSEQRQRDRSDIADLQERVSRLEETLANAPKIEE